MIMRAYVRQHGLVTSIFSRPARITSVLETESDLRLDLVLFQSLHRARLLCGPPVLLFSEFAVPS